MINSIQSFFHDPFTAISNVETFLQIFLKFNLFNLKYSLQNYSEVLKESFFCVICLAYSNLILKLKNLHTVLAVLNRLLKNIEQLFPWYW